MTVQEEFMSVAHSRACQICTFDVRGQQHRSRLSRLHSSLTYIWLLVAIIVVAAYWLSIKGIYSVVAGTM